VDLTKYTVNALLVEGRSACTMAESTGRSKSWAQRHVRRCFTRLATGLVPRKRGEVTWSDLVLSNAHDAIHSTLDRNNFKGIPRYEIVAPIWSAPTHQLSALENANGFAR